MLPVALRAKVWLVPVEHSVLGIRPTTFFLVNDGDNDARRNHAAERDAVDVVRSRDLL